MNFCLRRSVQCTASVKRAVTRTGGDEGWTRLVVNGVIYFNWRSAWVCLATTHLPSFDPPSHLMAWFASLFSNSKASVQGRRKVLSSTQEAFSLPSPGFAQNGLFTADSSLSSPDPESAITPSYTYPPQSSGTQYKYISTGCANSESFLTFLSTLNHAAAESPPFYSPHPCYPSTMPRSLPLLNTLPSSRHGLASEIGCRPNIPN
jgi:hypothetical protein